MAKVKGTTKRAAVQASPTELSGAEAIAAVNADELRGVATSIIEAKHILLASVHAYDSESADGVDFSYIGGAVSKMLEKAGESIDRVADRIGRSTIASVQS